MLFSLSALYIGRNIRRHAHHRALCLPGLRLSDCQRLSENPRRKALSFAPDCLCCDLPAPLRDVPQHILSSLSQVHTIGTLCLDFVKSKKDKFDIDEIKSEFKTILKDVQIHRDVWNLYPFQLSGGQLQRVIISIAILLKTEVIFLDEPTSALDQIIQKNMIKVLKKLNDKYKISLVIISHSEKVITEFSRNNLYLAKGDNNVK